MEEQNKDKIKDISRSRRGSAIIDGKQDNLRQDGYTNLLNKYGTAQDNSMAYNYEQEPITTDMELIRLYEGNGLFSKIIDRPAEEAVKHGLDIDYGDEKIAEYVEERLDELDFEDKFATAEKWARLYGGALIVMLCDDGGSLEEPLDYDKVRTIEELRVFERAIVQEDYYGLYQTKMIFSNSDLPIGQPEFYHINSIYGSFTVHYTRCLIFRNGRLPEQTTNSIYRHWGMPEHVKIKQALRECMTSHSNGTKLLERSVQAIYKMKNLATLLSSDEGEGKVLQRLQVIDMARGILNSMAIDAEGEDYDFKTLQMAGVKDVVDTTCNMLSAVTNIPQTILFGRSPAGMNSTGDSDLENYYNLVENIQKQNMKANVRTVINLILKQGMYEGDIEAIPKFKVKFSALWSISDSEQADIEQKKAQTEQTKAQIAQTYIDAGVLDASEVRKSLSLNGDFVIEDLIDEDDIELPLEEDIPMEDEGNNVDDFDLQIKSNTHVDNEYDAVAVLIIKDGKILCAKRNDSEFICGPGGHIEDGETYEQAVIREAIEEFNIIPLNILPLGSYKCTTGLYCNAKMYFTDQFKGIPKADGIEMVDARWLSLEELKDELLFPPFAESIRILENLLNNKLTKHINMGSLKVDNIDGGEGSGNFGHKGIKGQQGGSAKQGGGSKKSSSSSESKTSKEEKKKGKNNKKSSSKESTSGEENEARTGKTKDKEHEKESPSKKERSTEKKVKEKPQKETSTVSNESGEEIVEKTTVLPKPSARGENIPCKGFAKGEAAIHVKKHGAEFGYPTEDEYVENAKKFISQACGGDIDGYVTEDGEVCRFNIKTGEYGKGIPGGIIRTYFISKYSKKDGKSKIDIANKYFYKLKEKEGVKDEET